MWRARPFAQGLVLGFLLLFSSCATLFPPRPDREATRELTRSIDELLEDTLFIRARVGLKVISLADGQVLYERNSKFLFHPASNVKLLTTATALHVLGTNYKFKTAVYVDSLSPEGVVVGNLYLKGFGNPDLKQKDLDQITLQLKTMGVKRIEGDIVADASFFDDLFWGKGWMWDDEPSCFQAFISPITINDNCVHVVVRPGERVGDLVRVATVPQTSYLSLKNLGVTGIDTSENTLKVTRDLRQRSNTILVHGSLPLNSREREFAISVWQPELYATTLLRERFEAEGISVSGQTRLGLMNEQARQVALHEWPIDSVIVNINKTSDNLSAENTLKVIAAEKRGVPGTALNGISVMNEFLFSLGIDTTSYSIVDGSGLSHYNLISAETLAQLLTQMYKKKDLFELFYRSLPIAAVDGTLQNRMRGTAAAGNARAKTGTLTGVSALSGYVKTEDGDLLAFSILMEHFTGSAGAYRNVQDKIVDMLARLNRRAVVRSSDFRRRHYQSG